MLPPEVTLRIPDPQIQAGAELTLSATATDDVGIAEVRFYMDDAIIGVRNSLPYDLTMKIPADFSAKTLRFHAVAVDVTGQQSWTLPQQVGIVTATGSAIPALVLEKPTAMQRFVEKSPLQYQASLQLDDPAAGSGIAYVSFYLDGAHRGDAYFPIIEKRRTQVDGKSVEQTFELWRLNDLAPPIATTETSLAWHAVVHTKQGGEGKTTANLIRIIKNTPPSVVIKSPVAGTSVTAGQNLALDVEFADDTLPLGTVVTLIRDNRALDQFRYEDKEGRFVESFNTQRASHTFCPAAGPRRSARLFRPETGDGAAPQRQGDRA